MKALSKVCAKIINRSSIDKHFGGAEGEQQPQKPTRQRDNSFLKSRAKVRGGSERC